MEEGRETALKEKRKKKRKRKRREDGERDLAGGRKTRINDALPRRVTDLCLQDRRVTLSRYEPHATAICGAINKRINAAPLQTTCRVAVTSRGFVFCSFAARLYRAPPPAINTRAHTSTRLWLVNTVNSDLDSSRGK